MPELEDQFGGKIGRTYQESTPWSPEPPRTPDGAPNVVFIVLDDVGFADLGCYGSEIETPSMDRLAAGGLRYTNFHTTAMCSLTRASLLTGRNAHAVGMGAIAEWSNGYPGYAGRVSKRAAMLSEMLGEQGYNCLAVGKWHLMPIADMTATGPFDYRLLGRGGRYDRGWDAVRAEQLRKQKQLGVVPIDTELAPGDPGVEAWGELSDDQHRDVRAEGRAALAEQ